MLVIDLADNESAGGDVGVGVVDVVEDPENFVRESVTISGRLREAPGRAFLLQGEESAARLLVLPAQGMNLRAATEGDVVEVVGRVRRFDRGLSLGLGRDLELDLENRFFDPYAGRPTVIARQVGEVNPTSQASERATLSRAPGTAGAPSRRPEGGRRPPPPLESR